MRRSKIAPLYPWNRGGRLPSRTMLKRSNPYNGNYVLPNNVLDESRSGGAIVTRQVPRGTVSFVKPGNAGYAVPKYIQNESPWRGVRVTHQRPRGTIDQYVPNQFLGLGTLDGDSLGYWGESLVNRIGSGIKSAGRSVYNAGKAGAKLYMKVTCKINQNELVQQGANANPYTMVASKIASGLCPRGAVPQVGDQILPPQPQGINPTYLIAGGVGLVALVLLLK